MTRRYVGRTKAPLAEAEATIRYLEERLAEYMLDNAAIRAEARAAALDEARAAVHRAIDEWLASPADTDLTALIDAAIDALREDADKV